MTFTVYNTINTILENSSISFSSIFNYSLTNIGSFETLEEINRSFVKLFKDIINMLDTSIKAKKSDIVVNKILTIINEKYYDKNLCLNSLADSIGMSPIYVRKLFKESIGKSVAEYITDVRMQKVKYYIDTSSININEILDKVGIEKSNYFYTTFKKHFGISLNTYKVESLNKRITKNSTDITDGT